MTAVTLYNYDGMIFKNTLCCALCLYSLCTIGALIAQPQNASPTPLQNNRRSPKPLNDTLPLPIRGFALNFHHTVHLTAYLQAIDEMADLGCNSVEIVTPAFQTDGQSQQVRIETGPKRGPLRWQLLALLRHARQRGLTTTLMPQVLFTNPRGNEWRGKINPSNWEPWWNSYQRMIDYFLDIAQEASVDVFCVGSELLSTERQTDRWLSLIRHIRSRYNGLLTYSTNWDHYHVPTIWHDLDMIGVNGYWDLSHHAAHDPPSPTDLSRRWHQIQKKLFDFANLHGRPILLTEIGYPSLPWAIKDPWNYVHDSAVKADTHAQTQGYTSFLTAWGDLLSSDESNTEVVAGAFFYAWDPYRHGGEYDTGYGIRGKPAGDLLKQWLARSRISHSPLSAHTAP